MNLKGKLKKSKPLTPPNIPSILKLRAVVLGINYNKDRAKSQSRGFKTDNPQIRGIIIKNIVNDYQKLGAYILLLSIFLKVLNEAKELFIMNNRVDMGEIADFITDPLLDNELWSEWSAIIYDPELIKLRTERLTFFIDIIVLHLETLKAFIYCSANP